MSNLKGLLGQYWIREGWGNEFGKWPRRLVARPALKRSLERTRQKVVETESHRKFAWDQKREETKKE